MRQQKSCFRVPISIASCKNVSNKTKFPICYVILWCKQLMLYEKYVPIHRLMSLFFGHPILIVADRVTCGLKELLLGILYLLRSSYSTATDQNEFWHKTQLLGILVWDWESNHKESFASQNANSIVGYRKNAKRVIACNYITQNLLVFKFSACRNR